MKNLKFPFESVLRKCDGNDITRLSQRKRCGNAKHDHHFYVAYFPSYPSCGNVMETSTIRFPSLFRITETPYFTPRVNVLN